MFVFKKVVAQNFMSLHKMELDLDNRGVVLIEGVNLSNDTFQSNGSGKTSLLNSVTYALYDRTIDGVKADDVVNRKFGKDTEVILHFEVDDVPYRIERYRKHSEHKNKVKLFQGDTELTGKSNATTNKQILEIFGIDYDTYINSIMFGQGENVMFAQATDSRRKEILENVANLSIYKKAQEVAKERVKEKEMTAKEVENKIMKLDYELKSLERTYEHELATYEHTKSLLDEALENHERLLAEMEESDYETKLAELEMGIGYVETAYETAEVDEVPKPDTALLEANLNNWQEQVNVIETSIRVNENKVRELTNQRDRLKTDTTCSYCGSALNPEHALKEYERITKEIEALEATIHNTRTTLNTSVKPIIEQTKAEITRKQEEYEAAKREAYSSVLDLQKQVSELKTEKSSLENAMRNKQQEIEASQRNIDNLKSIPTPEDRAPEIESIRQQIVELNETLLATADSKERYEEAVKIFSNSGIRSVVLDLVTPYLNERANKYLATLSGSDIEIFFTPQAENKDGSLSDRFEVEIRNANGGETYKANSAGEKRRIDLAISFALQDLVLSKSEMRTNIALYDECFDGLDAIGCENVITLLKERQKQVGSIFVITHNATLKSLFEQTITVEKRDGVSRIVEGAKATV